MENVEPAFIDEVGQVALIEQVELLQLPEQLVPPGYGHWQIASFQQ